jgi:NADH:ubiquinone oxidoreductase subunit 5 (subunit L)/multisubunit Na+/H+ antiporter MnhA subunit
MRRRASAINWGAVTACGLHLIGWFAVNVLAAAGVMALILFAIGDFSLPITMAQLANLADRYVAANAIRRDQFDQEVIIGFFAILLLIAFFRRGGFARAFEDASNKRDPSNA